MTMWLPNLEGRRGPVYRAIADAIDEGVQDGTLRAGARLPPHRDLADHLGVTVTTITRAYSEAARRGLTSATSAAGRSSAAVSRRTWGTTPASWI
jgi:DNA-binding transcriptional MocR family regulator